MDYSNIHRDSQLMHALCAAIEYFHGSDADLDRVLPNIFYVPTLPTCVKLTLYRLQFDFEAYFVQYECRDYVSRDQLVDFFESAYIPVPAWVYDDSTVVDRLESAGGGIDGHQSWTAAPCPLAIPQSGFVIDETVDELQAAPLKSHPSPL